MACVVCTPEIELRIREGRPLAPPPEVPQGPIQERDGRLLDVHCPTCESRARVRALASMMARSAEFIRAEEPVFLVSSAPQERQIYSRYWNAFTHVSLLSDWGDPECRTGVDITAMPEIESGKYGVAIALNVLDYIPEAGQALKEIARILRPDGIFIFFIQSFRIEPTPGLVRMLNRNAYGDPAHPRTKDRETGIPDCRFDPEAMATWATGAGLVPGLVRYQDTLSRLETSIYTARKPRAR